MNLRLTVAITLALVPVTSKAQSLLVRTDLRNGTLGYTLDYTDRNGIEYYGVGYNTTYPEYGVGMLKQIYSKDGTTVLAGGYLASWPTHRTVGKLFVQPWVIATRIQGNLTLSVVAGVYIPLNGGPTAVFSNDSSLLYRVNRKVQLGVAATYWNQSDSKPELRFGPKVKANLGSGYGLSVAGYAFGNRRADYRVVLTHSF